MLAQGEGCLVVLGMDLDHTVRGEVTIGPRTKARCDAAIAYAREHFSQVHFVVTPDYNPARARRGKPMWLLMREYMCAQGCSRSEFITPIGAPGVWSTRGEIRAALALIRKHKLTRMALLFVSGRYHLWRIQMLVYLLARKNELVRWEVVAAPADPEDFGLYLHEVLAVPLNLFKLARGE